MQNLEVISVNIWNILYSLANLTILFLVVKKFLFKPVKAVFEKREKDISERYSQADIAKAQAQSAKAEYEEKLEKANLTADEIIRDAKDSAKIGAQRIIDEANGRAQSIVKRAEEEADLQRRSAEEDIKREIVDISALLATRMLDREVKAEDHKKMIDSFIDNIGDNND